MSPLERAARALVNTYPLDSGETPLNWQDVIPVARAVIEAIREPSEPMLKAPGKFLSSDEMASIGMAAFAWPEMIDALLAEGK